jgi:hypothetical protein
VDIEKNKNRKMSIHNSHYLISLELKVATIRREEEEDSYSVGDLHNLIRLQYENT